MARKKTRKRRSDKETDVGHFFLKWSTKLVLGLVIAIIFLTLAQCTVKKPESPTWESQLVVPMISRTYSMDEIIDKIDQDGIAINDQGGVSYTLTEEIDTVTLDQADLSTSDLSYSLSQNVGTVELNPPDGDSVRVSLGAISGLATALPGDSGVVIPTSFSLFNAMSVNSPFLDATISTGFARARIFNDLDINLDTIIVTINDQTYGPVVTDTIAGILYAGQTATHDFILDGKSLTNDLRLDVRCHTPGGTVHNFSTRSIESGLFFPAPLEISSASAQIPALSRGFVQGITLNESFPLERAVLSSGDVNLDVTNATNLDADVFVTFNDVKLNGIPLTLAVPIPANQTQNVPVSLIGYEIAPSDLTVPQQLNLTVLASMPGSGTDFVTIDAADSFTVQASLSNLGFESVRGVFDLVSTPFDNVIANVDVPTGFDQIEIQAARVILTVESSVDLPGSVDIRVTGDNGHFVDLTGNLPPAGDSIAITTFEIYDSANFLAPIPSQINVTGTVDMGDGVYSGTLNANDFVHASVRAEAPLAMIIPQTPVETDIESETIEQNDIDKIIDHYIEGRFVYKLLNRLPVGASVNLYFGPDSATLFSNPQLRLPKPDGDSIIVAQAPVDAFGLAIDTASTGYREIALDSVDIQIIKNDTLYFGTELVLEDSNGQIVRLMQSDYLQIVGRIELEYNFDGEF